MSKRLFFLLATLILGLSCFLGFWELDNVDIEASEDIYVSDSVGYLRGDPFMVPRQHLRKPHAPASPHPFLVPMLTHLVFQITDVSISAARYLQAFSLVATTTVMMYISWLLFRSYSLCALVGLVYTTFPLIVRFSRMAVLDPVFSLFGALIMLWSWQMIHTRGFLRYIFALLVGMGLALAASSKLTGIFFSIPIFLFIVWNYLKSRDRTLFFSISLILISFCVTFILFNDPYSYRYGWTHFSDPKHRYVSLLSTLKGFIAFRYWYHFIISFLGIGIILLCIALVRYRKWWINTQRIFVSLWIAGPLLYLVINPIHITGLSAEWSYVPVFAPLAIVTAKTLMNVGTYIQKTLVIPIFVTICLYILLMLPLLILYGLRFGPMPLASYYRARNVVRGSLAVTKTIAQLNKDSGEVSVLLSLRSVGFPLWLLKDNIHTEPFYHPIDSYHYIVTDDVTFIEKAIQNNFFIVSQEKNPTEREVLVFKNPNH